MQEFLKNLTFATGTSLAGLATLTTPGCAQPDSVKSINTPHLRQTLTISLLKQEDTGVYELRSLNPRISLMYLPDANDPVSSAIAKQLDQFISAGVVPGTKLLRSPFTATFIYRGDELGLSPTRQTFAVVDLFFKKPSPQMLGK